MPTVSQTSVIFFALLVGFIVFITVRGQLSGYLYVIGLSSAPLDAAKQTAIDLNGALGSISTFPTNQTTTNNRGR